MADNPYAYGNYRNGRTSTIGIVPERGSERSFAESNSRLVDNPYAYGNYRNGRTSTIGIVPERGSERSFAESNSRLADNSYAYGSYRNGSASTIGIVPERGSEKSFAESNSRLADNPYAYGGYRNGSASTIGIVPERGPAKLGKSRQWLGKLIIIGGPILLCAILLLILMLVPGPQPRVDNTSTRCIPSAESKSSKYMETLKKIQDEYFSILHPQKIYAKPGATPEEIRLNFQPWDPTPSTIERKTKQSNKLLEDLNKLKINMNLLKIRERKAYHVAKGILLNNYGWLPLGQNYYAGDWMLGPDMYCMQPICEVFANLGGAISHFKPRNISDLHRLDNLLKQYKHTFERYIENLKLGVRAGYVRSSEACKSGLYYMHYLHYRNIALQSASGVYKESFSTTIQSTGFFDQLSKDDNKTWRDDKGQDVLGYFNRSLLTYIGQPAFKMLRYVEGEHLRNCPPETLYSGLKSLPLPYVYEGNPDPNQSGVWNLSVKTTKKLPTGQQLNGRETFENLMRYYTTKDIKPAELKERAERRLDKLYKKALDLVKNYTGNNDEVKARKAFITEIQKQDQSFNERSFPVEESNDKAFVKCFDDKSAKEHCPQRWEAMQTWIQNTAKIIEEKLKPLLKHLFYEDGPKNCVPKCPIEVIAWYHPSSVFHAYFIGAKDCSVKASQALPFFTENYGPKWTEYTTAVHEFAGHHIEVQSFTEYFQSDCNDPIAWLNAFNYFPAITEGWAAYVEDELFPDYTTLYTTKDKDKEILRQKYGMLYYQILHALRPIVDIDLNFYGRQVSDVRDLYRQYLWEDNNHQVNKDIIRIQSQPGFVTSYLIGQEEISSVKKMAEGKLGKEFSLKDFHYEILREGEFPLAYLEEHINAYISCKKDPQKTGCKEFV